MAAVTSTCNAFSLGNDDYYKVRHVYSWEGGNVHLWLEKNGGEHECSDQTYTTRYLMSREKSDEFDQKFTLLVAARTTGEGVRLEYSCDENGLPWIDSVRF